MAFINFTNTAGETIAVQSDCACAVVPIAASVPSSRILLAAGGEAADAAAPYVDVVGTVAATVAALAGAGAGLGRILGGAIVTGAGAILAGFGLLDPLAGAGAVRNAAGDYTVTFSALPGSALPVITSASGGPEIVAADGPLGATQDVKTFDAAGAPADATFVFTLVGFPV